MKILRHGPDGTGKLLSEIPTGSVVRYVNAPTGNIYVVAERHAGLSSQDPAPGMRLGSRFLVQLETGLAYMPSTATSRFLVYENAVLDLRDWNAPT